MEKFLLYRSGIHDATFIFDKDGIQHQKRDISKLQWEDVDTLTVQTAKAYEDVYLINPRFIWERFKEYENMLKFRKREYITLWGGLYEKHEDDEHLWVERNKKYPLDVLGIDGQPTAFITVTRENCIVLVREGFEHLTPVQQWKEKKISQAINGVSHIGTHMVEMRDHVKLATEIWLPSEVEEKVPAILIRTPYGRMAYGHSYDHFIQRGYAVVIQDTRGRQDSEGEWIPMYSEMEDGDDTLHWIAKQPWCNGNIGMTGGSYGGFVQWAAAASGNPHLKAMISIVTAGTPFVDMPRRGGPLSSGMLAWAFAMVDKVFRPENMARPDWEEVLKIRPLRNIPTIALGKEVAFWHKWLDHPVYDSFWSKSNWYQHKDNIKAPALIVSGWYDDNGMGTTEACEVVAGYPCEHKKIILGPWMHSANTTRDIHGVRFGNNALRYDLDYYYQAWFDHHLKQMDNGIEQTPVVEYYVVGDQQWKTANQWPPEQVQWTNMYLSSNGCANTSQGDGELLFSDHVHEGVDRFIYDPLHPAPHLIDMSENEVAVPENYKEVEMREDVLVYTSAPLTEPLTIAGDVKVTIFAASSAKDTDWIVRLTDVDEFGNSIKLADGVFRARYRKGFHQEVLLTPNQVEKYEIRTSKIANTFRKGHRIRLSITSSADHLIFPNTNTGEDPATDTETVKATQQIFHDKSRLSSITLPIIPN